MTQIEIQLIRHGETDWNVQNRYQGSTDIPLNETGRQQAAALADAMRGEEWDRMVSSPLSRAMETAQAVADAIGVSREDIIADARAMERSYGEAEGLTLQEREQVWPGGEWPGLETWESVALRAMAMMEELVRDLGGQRIIVVAHGGLINSILATISEGEVGTGKSIILNTSRTDITHDNSNWTIGAISEASHLEDAIAR